MLFETALAKQKFVVSVIWGTTVVQMGLGECLNMMRMMRIIRNAIKRQVLQIKREVNPTDYCT